MYILLPFSTQLAPSRLAVLRIERTSEPASGSVTATAVIFSPATMAGMYRSSCACEPAFMRCGEAMSVCTSTVTANPPNDERPSSSASSAVPSKFISAPPYFSG